MAVSVAPHAGAWIETTTVAFTMVCATSLPTRERGLKHFNGKDFELDPMFFKGNFYKDGVNRPKYTFDLNPQDDMTVKGNAENLPLDGNSLERIILDPPFLFGVHGKTKDYYSSKTHTIYENFDELYVSYENILKEAYRLLKRGGHLVFKCQDYTDSTTTMTHCIVYLCSSQYPYPNRL